MDGDGFVQFWPSIERVAVGGTNPILVDRVGAQLLGLWNHADLARELGGHATSPLLETAAKRFGVDITSPAVTGDGAALLSGTRPVHFVGMASFSVHFDASPAFTPAAIGALGAAAAPAATPTAPPAAPRPVVHAAALGDATIVLDSFDKDEAWSKATPATWDTDTAGERHGHRHARALPWPELIAKSRGMVNEGKISTADYLTDLANIAADLKQRKETT